MAQAPVDPMAPVLAAARTLRRVGRAATTASQTATPAGRAFLVMLAAFALTSLLSANTLVRVARAQPYGARRTVALSLARPLRAVSHTFGLHLPRLWLAELTGNEDLPTADEIAAPVPRGAGPLGAGFREPAPPPTTAVPTTTLPPRRAVSPQAPLQVWMGGDSLMGAVSDAFTRLAQRDGRMHVVADVRESTGLARPDVLDWPTYLGEQLNAAQPEVVLLMMGGNDDQPLRVEGRGLALGTPEWSAEYRRRIGILMDVAGQEGRTVVWVGLPSVRPEHLNTHKDAMNHAAWGEARKRPFVYFVDSARVLTPGGTYQDDATAVDGPVVRARARDGVHLSQAGADLVAPLLFHALARDWPL